MALSATAIAQIQQNGSDTLNAGLFNPANTHFLADLTCTGGTSNTPVVGSSYVFTVADVGDWVVIVAGTNWFKVALQIQSVAGGLATLAAAIGQGFLLGGDLKPNRPTVVAGCASVATQSTNKGTFGVDTSQRASAKITFTDMTIGVAGATFTSAANPVTTIFPGSHVRVTGGTNAIVGDYEVVSVAGTVATLDRNWTTGACSNGAGGMGGAFATPGEWGSVIIAGQTGFMAYSASVYAQTSITSNVAGGVITLPNSNGNTTRLIGYNTNRCLTNTDANRPTFQAQTAGLAAGGNGLVNMTGPDNDVLNLIVDINSVVTTCAFNSQSGNRCRCINCKVTHATARGFYGPDGVRCEVVAADQYSFFEFGNYYFCVAIGPATNSLSGQAGYDQPGFVEGCIAVNTAKGFVINTATATTSVAYGCASTGFDFTAVGAHTDSKFTYGIMLVAWGNGQNYLGSTSTTAGCLYLMNCATGFNNVTGVSNDGSSGDTVGTDNTQNLITLTADPFVHAASSPYDFTPTSTAPINGYGNPLNGLGVSVGTDHQSMGAMQPAGGGTNYYPSTRMTILQESEEC